MPEFRLDGKERKTSLTAKLGLSESRKEKVNAHEQSIAEKLGGRRQPNSGALDGHKGDVKLDHFLLDSKETEAASIMVTAKDLMKITCEANEVRREPGLVLTLKVAPTVSREWVLIPIDVFAAMVTNKQDENLKNAASEPPAENVGGAP